MKKKDFVSLLQLINKVELITEKQLRDSVIGVIITKPTFYRYWEEIKKTKLVKGKLKNWEIVLSLTEKGKIVLNEHQKILNQIAKELESRLKIIKS